MHPDTAGTTVTSDNVAVISGGDVAADGTHVVLRTAGDGTCNVTASNTTAGVTISDTISVTVGVPVPTEVAMDVDHAASVPKGTAA